MRKLILVSILFVCNYTIFAQSTANYTFTTNTGATLTDMSSGTTDLIPNTGSEQDNVSSAVTTFPNDFEFWFMGVRYRQFSVNTNGIMQLGGTQISSAQVNIGSASLALISPLTRNNSTTNLALNSTGKIHYKLEGTYPNRVFTIEWKDMEIDKYAGANYANGTFQVQLQEITNEIRIVYQNGIALHTFANTTNYQVGISSSNTTNTVHSASNIHSGTLTSTAGSSANNNTCVAGQAIGNLQGNRILKYTPTASVTARTSLSFPTVTSTSVTLSWSGTTDYRTAIYYSTDNVNWKYGTDVAATTTSATVTGLKCGTTYYWKVYSVNAEGRFSASLDGTQATAVCQPSANGFWHDPTIWPGNSVPTGSQNVHIPSPRQITVNSFSTDALCNNLSIANGASLTLSSSEKLIINGSLTLDGALNVPTTTGCSGGGSNVEINYTTGTCITDDRIPIYRGTYTKVRMQFIYQSSESAVAALNGYVISGITFSYGYMIGGSGQYSFNLSNVKVRLGHTTTNSFSGNFINPSDFTEVASLATLTFDYYHDEVTIPFSSGFTYNTANGNLLVELTYETDGNTAPYVNVKRCGTIPTNTHIYTANNCAINPQNITYNVGCTAKDASQGSYRPGLKAGTCSPSNWGSFNATVDIYGNWIVNSTGTFNPVLGTVNFVGSNNQTITPRTYNATPPTNTFYNLNINKSDNSKTLTINTTNNNDSIVVTNKLTLSKGVINTASNNGVSIRNTAPYSLVYNTSKNSTGWINGNLRRRIASNTSVYGFPMGTATDYRLCEIVNNNLSGITYIDASYTNTPDGTGGNSLDPNKAIDFGSPYESIVDAEWKLTPNNQPSTGSYDIRLYWDDGRNVNIFSLEDNQYGILKRPDNSTNYYDFEATGSLNANNGEGRTMAVPYALRKALTSFSKFTIGKSLIPLPVELLDNKINCSDNVVTINWTTASESNNAGFVIEKSNDLKSWTNVGFVKGSGNTNKISNYTFSDSKGASLYYRIIQIDFNKKQTVLGVLSANCLEKDLERIELIRTNDSSNYSIIISTPYEQKAIVKVLDITGRNVMTKERNLEQGTNTIQLLNEDNIKKGVYFINVYLTNSQLQKTFKVVMD